MFALPADKVNLEEVYKKSNHYHTWTWLLLVQINLIGHKHIEIYEVDFDRWADKARPSAVIYKQIGY